MSLKILELEQQELMLGGTPKPALNIEKEDRERTSKNRCKQGPIT